MEMPARDRALSTAIGPYVLERRLGRGGMGEVYRAFDERLRRRVAIKHVIAEKAEKANLRQRLRREARTVARLNHPAIVQIYDILETEEGDWIVMELVEGRTVRDLVDAGELPLPQALRLVREVATGLAVAHENGVVHRDLKLENVMVNDKGQAKILDFGLAKQLEKKDPGDTTLSGEGMVVGTIRALSPEQVREQEVDTRSDLFSFGTLLYEICTGESPFTADSIVTTMTKVCSHRQPPAASLNPEVPSELSDFVDRLLEKDREHRPQTAVEVVEFFDRLIGETTAPTPFEGLPDAISETADEDSRPFAKTDPATTDPATTEPAKTVPAKTVAEGRRRLRPVATPPDGAVAIKTLVATQVADRPGLTERLGEEGAAAVLARLDEARAELLREHFGHESARAGHVLMTLERPAAAVELALAYHRKTAALSRELEIPLAVRQGIHLGEVAMDPRTDGPEAAAGRVTALVASRVMDLARPGQILFTHSVDELVKRSAIARRFGDQEVRWQEHGLYRLPGIGEELELFEVGFAGDAPLSPPEPPEGTRADGPAKGLRPARVLLAGVLAAALFVSTFWLRGCFSA